MIEQLKTIREALWHGIKAINHLGGAREAMPLHDALRGPLTQLEAMVGEPYGTVTVVRNPGCAEQHWLYRWPDPPYLDNAAECHTVYAAAPVAQQPQEIEVQCPVCNHKFYEWPNDKQPQAESDAYCITTPDGDCISTDPRCMHQPQAEAASDDLRDRLVAISAAIADQDDRAAQAMIREILAAPQQAEAVPPGYVLVPEEPTEAMLKAASRACEGRLYPADMRHGPRAQNSDRYRAMIAAAIAQQKGGA